MALKVVWLCASGFHSSVRMYQMQITSGCLGKGVGARCASSKTRSRELASSGRSLRLAKTWFVKIASSTTTRDAFLSVAQRGDLESRTSVQRCFLIRCGQVLRLQHPSDFARHRIIHVARRQRSTRATHMLGYIHVSRHLHTF